MSEILSGLDGTICMMDDVLIYGSVGRYHIFTFGIRYYKLRTVFGIPRYLINKLDEPLSSVNG